MSLPNPDSVVTEERLSEFYAGIRPYLGGMPDVLANKFNKSDLYSTDEQLIGRWIDGKPLYQKVIIDTMPQDGSNPDKYVSINANVDTFVNHSVTAYNNGGIGFPLPYINNSSAARYTLYTNSASSNPNTVRLTSNVGATFGAAIIIISYTKTSDSAIYVGSDTDYSTDEKIIGTWIDGKPIYQRTYDEGRDVTVESSQWYESTHDATNIAKYISAEFTLSGGNNMYPGMIGTTTVGATGQNVVGLQNCLNRSFKFRYMTIRYTKTTD